MGGWNSLYHVRTKMSVERGIILDISVHNTYKGEELFFSKVCTLKKANKLLK